MHAFAAIFNRCNNAVNLSDINHLASNLQTYPNSRVYSQIFHNVGLGIKANHKHECRRVAITPIESKDRCSWIVFTGRIDNRSELFSLLPVEFNQPNEFISDAQLVLEGYLYQDARWLEKLHGSYIFIIYFTLENRLILCRDPIGDQKLCYKLNHDSLLVATDESAIVNAYSKHCIDINKHQIAAYFTNQNLNQTQTVFKNINHLPPGHILEVTETNHRMHQFWMFNRKKNAHSDSTSIKLFRQKFQHAISRLTCGRIQLPILLSGGMDSSSICALAMQNDADKYKVYAISHVFNRFSDCDERYYLNALYKKLNLKHIQVNVDDCLPLSNDPNQLHRTLNHIWVPPMIWQRRKSYLILQDRNSQCFLTGEFGDHLFAAYRYWFRDLFRKGTSISTLFNAFRHLQKSTNVPLYLNPVFRRIFPFNGISAKYRQQIPPWLTDQAKYYLSESSGIKVNFSNQYFERDRYENYFNQNSLDLISTIREEAMAYNLEPLIPFRDREFVEYTLNLPAYLFYDYNTDQHKYILRRAMAGILPEVVRQRREATVYNSIFRTSLTDQHKHIVEDILLSANRNWPEFVREDYLLPKIGQTNVTDADLHLIWNCICYELWCVKLKNS